MIHKNEELPKNLGGRPSKLTQEVIDTICEHVGQGVPYDKACWLADVSERIVQMWKKQGESDESDGKDTMHARFFRAVKKAEANNIIEMTQRIRYGHENWTSAAWLLERRHKEHYGKEQAIELKTPKPLQYVDMKDWSPEQLRALAGEEER